MYHTPEKCCHEIDAEPHGNQPESQGRIYNIVWNMWWVGGREGGEKKRGEGKGRGWGKGRERTRGGEGRGEGKRDLAILSHIRSDIKCVP